MFKVRLLSEDRLLQLLERAARFEPEFVEQHAPCVSERRQRVGLPARSVEREHEIAPEALAMRVLCDQPLELAHELRVPTERESRLAKRLQAGDPQLLEPRDLALRKLLVRDVVERRASPQCECPLERPLCALRVAGHEQPATLVQETDEAVGVDLIRTRLEHVAASARAQPIRVEQLAQPRDVRLQALVCRRRLHAAV